MPTVVTSLALAFRQLADPRILAILAKSVGVTLAAFAAFGWIGWNLLDFGLGWLGLDDTSFRGAEEARGLVSLLLTILGGWLLWRIIAVAVIQFYANEVVLAVERQHYPETMGNARELAFSEEFRAGMLGAARALLINLIALPFALILLVTGIGTALLFWLVNAILIGRELHDMVWLRHRQNTADIDPATRMERFLLGGTIAGLLLVPFVHFLAPVIGAAAATHLIHLNRRVHNAA